ncbi:DUF4190 domain-containing protein [Mycolicibacterium confluentis]|uniref:DUF4190 domain-containing protein n=1 Tax=Mycolicibacterium confluentis TaxID=28047 RepID=A0A7I7Y3V2_9MYCO|nr:DUF4190 domain-containing protein [Mycolicibacterium confluentis]BBZ36014.1 hypothetical protein MCNF_46190 [Mycolicibacterium confluentis]
MTFGGQQHDPFGGDPFGTPGGPPVTQSGFGMPVGSGGYPPYPPPPQPAPQGEVNTLATLSVVFAILSAPVGAVLGHIALSQVKRTGQRGRERALVGVTLSYLVIVLAVVALILWLVLGGDADPEPATVTPTPTTTSAVPPTTRTTVVTPPPMARPTVLVEDLRIGDCVEVVQERPKPGEPGVNLIKIYRTPCQIRDGVLRVDLTASYEGACPGYALRNLEKTVFACVSDFRG